MEEICCSRCVKVGKADTCVSQQAATWAEALEIPPVEEPEAPIPFVTSSFRFDLGRPETIPIPNDWSFAILSRLWSVGYSPQVLLKFINSLPEDLVVVLRRALVCLEQVSQSPFAFFASAICVYPGFCHCGCACFRLQASSFG